MIVEHIQQYIPTLYKLYKENNNVSQNCQIILKT